MASRIVTDRDLPQYLGLRKPVLAQIFPQSLVRRVAQQAARRFGAYSTSPRKTGLIQCALGKARSASTVCRFTASSDALSCRCFTWAVLNPFSTLPA
jgi:hypothetical protein